jgi:hypothetical protein
LIRPDTKVLESLARLRGNTDWVAVLAWIADSRHDNFLQLEDAVKEDVERMRGYGLALRDLLQHATKARDSLNKRHPE